MDGEDEEKTNELREPFMFLFSLQEDEWSIMKHFVKKLWTQIKCRCFLLLRESERKE